MTLPDDKTPYMLPPEAIPITPPSPSRCAQLVERFQEDFPEATRARCQAAVAAVLFFDGWPALCQAQRDGYRGQPWDEALDASELSARRYRQIEALCFQLGGFGRKNAPSLLERRSFVMLAREILYEYAPSSGTSRATVAPQIPRIYLTLSDDAWLERFPEKLGQWWSREQPGNPRIASYLQTQRIRPGSLVSLLRFARFWGTVCSRAGSRLPASLLLGTAYLLAEHFAAVHLQRNPVFLQALIQSSDLGWRGAHTRLHPFCPEQRRLVRHFLEVYHRDDFVDLFAKYPGVFMRAGWRSMKLLDPGTPRQALLSLRAA